MKVSNQIAMGVHILLAIDKFGGKYKVTSEFLAGSLQVNPVMVRQILTNFKAHGFTDIVDRSKGFELTTPLEKLSLYDVYTALNFQEKNIFGFHDNPNPQCPVGKNIHALLDSRFDAIQNEFEQGLKSYSLCDMSLELDCLIRG